MLHDIELEDTIWPALTSVKRRVIQLGSFFSTKRKGILGNDALLLTLELESTITYSRRS